MKKNVLVTNILIASIGIIAVLMVAIYFVAPQADASFGGQNRPTPTPSGKDDPELPEDGGGNDGNESTKNTVEIRGATIQLIGTSVTTNLWSVVQWKGGNTWHDVEGWRGTFNQENLVIWWVGHENLGSGPFRWVVYQDETI